MRGFAGRRPFAFAVLVTLAVFGLELAIRVAVPRTPVGNVEKWPNDAFEPPVGLALILSDMRSPDTLFWAMVTVLALGLLVWTGLALSWRRFFSRKKSTAERPLSAPTDLSEGAL